MAIEKPVGKTLEGWLRFETLEAVVAGDRAYVTGGDTEDWDGLDYFNTHDFMLEFLTALEDTEAIMSLGELAEMPSKTESKITKLKTRNYQIPGKRTTTVELTLNGISEKQRDWFESRLFAGEVMSIFLLPNELFMHDIDDDEDWKFESGLVVFSGLRWTADWEGETDGLWKVVLSTEFSGNTRDSIVVRKLKRAIIDVPGLDGPGEEGEEG